jgi:hypothetical protein
MLHFFRSIRQGLINEGKTSKYCRYAFGEIVLIVVGILIALQIQNWNEARKERVKEIKILVSLDDDFKLNLENLEAAIHEYAAMEESTLTAMRYIGESAEALQGLDPLTLIRTTYALTEIVDGTLNSVLSTDKLELLKDDSLKRLLTAYPAAI